MKADNGSTVRLHMLAHARTGDKGNHCNISLFAYRPELYSLLVEAVTAERVRQLFAFRSPSVVRRHVLPQLHGFNFVLEDVLDGGVNESLNLDMHGKSLSFLLLSLELQVPQTLLDVHIDATRPEQCRTDAKSTRVSRKPGPFIATPGEAGAILRPKGHDQAGF
jgi:hypothetical protein